jgi:carboxyl-terminal processing protease
LANCGLALLLAIVPLAAPDVSHAASASELLEKGIYTEETRGDLKSATQIYQQIVDDPGADRSLVAQAQLRIGLCELKLGRKPQAISALERLTETFPDKGTLLALVEPHMPQVLDEIVKQIEQNYIREVDRNELLETALSAIVGKLDSTGGFLRTNDLAFLNTNEMAELNVSLEQKIAGVGAVLTVKENKVVIQDLLPNSPASRSGIRAGDTIVKINGATLPNDAKLAAVVKLLRGEPGSEVLLTIERQDNDQPIDIPLVRDVIQIASVTGDHRKPDGAWDYMLDAERGIGYVRVSQVGKLTPSELKTTLEELTSRQAKALILDLRDNPGGSLSEAVTIADLFVEEGRILSVKSRTEEKVYNAKLEGTYSAFHMAVLINRGTASAAEIIAACLQDHQRAVVIGERTFGQAIVRSLIPLKSGAGALKLPVAVYYRPNGRNINRYPNSADSDDWGVRPDPGCELTLTAEEMRQAMSDRAARGKSVGKPDNTAAPLDPQVQMALDRLLAQLK